MTRPVEEILAKAQREGWPTSFIDAMANHHRCGGIARDYVNSCFTDSEQSALGSEKGNGGSPEGCGSSPRQGPHPPTLEETRMANSNCPQCHGTGWRRPTPFEEAQSGGADVRCGC